MEKSPIRIHNTKLDLRQIFNLKSYFLSESKTLRPIIENGQKLRGAPKHLVDINACSLWMNASATLNLGLMNSHYKVLRNINTLKKKNNHRTNEE